MVTFLEFGSAPSHPLFRQLEISLEEAILSQEEAILSQEEAILSEEEAILSRGGLNVENEINVLNLNHW